MEEVKKYIELNDLYVYKVSRDYSRKAWAEYDKFNFQIKKVIGDQWIRSVDSVGANIAEGYGRYHYADKNKFYYNARGSLIESQHWLDLLQERNIVQLEVYNELNILLKQILIALNRLISSQYQAKNNN